MQADIWLRCILEIVIKANVAQLQAHMINQWIYPIIMLFKFPRGWLQQCTSTSIARQCHRCRDMPNPCFAVTRINVNSNSKDTNTCMSTEYTHRHTQNYHSHRHSQTFPTFSFLKSQLDHEHVTKITFF